MGLLAGTKWDRAPQCERCNLPEEECKCPPPEPEKKAPQKQSLRVAAEKRKHGRTMTVVRDLIPSENDLHAILQKLKNACGAGGTIDGDNIEVQGNHVDRVKAELQKLGYRVR
jgi:translation initiation factor 1